MNDQVFRLIQFLFPGCNDEPDQNDVQQEPSKIIIMYSTSNLVKIFLKNKLYLWFCNVSMSLSSHNNDINILIKKKMQNVQ